MDTMKRTTRTLLTALALALALGGCNDETEEAAETTADLAANEAVERAQQANEALEQTGEAIVEGAEEINARVDEAEQAVEDTIVRETRGAAAETRAEVETVAHGVAVTARAAHEAGERAEREAEMQ